MTPVTNPTTVSEIGYNDAHAKTRNIVERCFGVLKSRFRCLDKTGGTLLYTPEKVCQIFVASSVLHNFCIDRNIPIAPIDQAVLARHQQLQPGPAAAAAGNVQNIQQALVVQRNVIAQF